MAVYVLDTSIWIRIGRNHPPDIFVSLWGHLDQGIANGTICSPEEVLHELEQGTDNLADVLSAKDGLFVPLATELQAAVSEVNEQCPSLHDPESDRNRADPFVVALGKLKRATVVSGEGARKSPNSRLKIPDACGVVGVTVTDWFAFLRAQGWRL